MSDRRRGTSTWVRLVAGGIVVLGSHLVAPLPCSVAQSGTHPLTGTDRVTGSVAAARAGRNLGVGHFQPVRIQAPEGVWISVGSPAGFDTEQPAPFQLGLQVGNTYRFRVSQIPLMEGVELYPTVEMIDRLHPPANRQHEFPIPIELTIEELRDAAAGALITRVIYVDDPRNPSFETLREGQPYFEVFPTEDPLMVADELGRPVAILRIGAKAAPPGGPDADFLFHAPPVEIIPEFANCPSGDTVSAGDATLVCPCDLGNGCDFPRDEYLCDGGDGDYRSQVNGRGELLGLEPSDTVARFTTLQGEEKTASGNRVCIYAPRFAATRKTVRPSQESLIRQARNLQDPLEAQHAINQLRPAPATEHLEVSHSEVSHLTRTLQDKNRGLLVEDRHAAVANLRSELPHANLTEVSAAILESRDLLATLEGTTNAISWDSAQAVQVVLEGAVAETAARVRQPQAIDLYEMPPGQPRLRLIKLASTDAAQKGEPVTFTIRYCNIGQGPLRNVAIIDDLLPRLVYQEGSQTSTAAAEFSQDRGSEGTTRLTWSLTEPLESGEGGEIQFRCLAE